MIRYQQYNRLNKANPSNYVRGSRCRHPETPKLILSNCKPSDLYLIDIASSCHLDRDIYEKNVQWSLLLVETYIFIMETLKTNEKSKCVWEVAATINYFLEVVFRQKDGQPDWDAVRVQSWGTFIESLWISSILLIDHFKASSVP